MAGRAECKSPIEHARRRAGRVNAERPRRGHRRSGVEVETLSHDGRGIAHIDGKLTFIEGALPAERVVIRYLRCRGRFDEAEMLELERPSPARTEPRCRHFGVCGGCSLQHLDPGSQLAHKQEVLLEQLRQQVGPLRPGGLLPPVAGPLWGYRRKARLGVKYVEKKNGLVVGFRERHKRFVAQLDSCEVLHPAVGMRLTALRDMLSGLTVCRRIPQIEVAAGDSFTALVIRVLEPPSASDRHSLAAFAATQGVEIYLQPGGPDTVQPLFENRSVSLSYRLPDQDVEIAFAPTDFTQVNTEINRRMVTSVIALLQPGPEDHVLDLFCGLGNFSIPLARKAGAVTGVEGDLQLVDRARHNAAMNRVDGIEFHLDDLTRCEGSWRHGTYSKILLDPPRTGAREVLENLDLGSTSRIVYVSCNAATLARDAGILVNEKSWRLVKTGVLDMFPHTAHLEALAVFEPRRR